MKNSYLAVCMAVLMLTASCKDIMQVQMGYVADRDECQSQSESNATVYTQPESSNALSDKERNTALLQLFCECMKAREWRVAGCPKPPVPAAVAAAPPAQPTVVVVQAPAAQPAVVQSAPPPPASPAPAQPVKTAAKKTKKYCALPTTNGICTAPANATGASSTATPTQTDTELQTVIQRQ